MDDDAIDSIIDRLWPTGRESVFALLDAARDERIFQMLDRSRLDYRCMFIGKLAPKLARVAPYLVHLGSLSKETHRILGEGWGHGWGVFVRADVLLQELWRHFRGLLQVQDERGRQMLFRFYDPRVLRLFLPTCTPKELERVFGPVERFLMEDGLNGLVEFVNREGFLEQTRDVWGPRTPDAETSAPSDREEEPFPLSDRSREPS